MCIHIDIYIYIHIYVCIYIYIHICICIYIGRLASECRVAAGNYDAVAVHINRSLLGMWQHSGTQQPWLRRITTWLRWILFHIDRFRLGVWQQNGTRQPRWREIMTRLLCWGAVCVRGLGCRKIFLREYVWLKWVECASSCTYVVHHIGMYIPIHRDVLFHIQQDIPGNTPDSRSDCYLYIHVYTLCTTLGCTYQYIWDVLFYFLVRRTSDLTSLCVVTCVHTHTYIHTDRHTHTFTNTHTYIHTDRHTHTFLVCCDLWYRMWMYVYVCLYVYMYVCSCVPGRRTSDLRSVRVVTGDIECECMWRSVSMYICMCVCVSTDGEDRTFLRQKSPHFDFCDFDFFKTRFFFDFHLFFWNGVFAAFPPRFSAPKQCKIPWKYPRYAPLGGSTRWSRFFKKNPFFGLKRGRIQNKAWIWKQWLKCPVEPPKTHNTVQKSSNRNSELRVARGGKGL